MDHYTEENTQGTYTDEELAALNMELAAKLEGIEEYTDEWYECMKRHFDETARSRTERTKQILSRRV